MAKKTMRFRIDKENDFRSIFDTETGEYARITSNNVNAPDAFQSSMPELIDIGIMGKCDRGCGYCYQNAKPTGSNMAVDDYFSILDQVKEDVYQVALGGAGNPNEHENFEEIIRRTREDYNIVPNYTTNGDHLTDEQIELSKKYCGAVAVSVHEGDGWRGAARRLIAAGVKTNTHFILSERSISDAVEMLTNPKLHAPEGLNAVVFLLYKPVGRGSDDLILKQSDEFNEFCELVKTWSGPFKLGFDSCSSSFIIDKELANLDSIDCCEASRFSCYINPDLTVVPCSFDIDKKLGMSLKEHSLKEIWNSHGWNNLRQTMMTPLCNCDDKKRHDCKGGCWIKKEIVLCSDEGKSSEGGYY